jgi:hypothetical protein
MGRAMILERRWRILLPRARRPPMCDRRLALHIVAAAPLWRLGGQSVDTSHVFPAGTAFVQDSSFWNVQPGIEHKWLPLGTTTIFGEYRHDDPGSNPDKTVDASINF